jgi:hypothetical protein
MRSLAVVSVPLAALRAIRPLVETTHVGRGRPLPTSTDEERARPRVSNVDARLVIGCAPMHADSVSSGAPG